MERPYLCHASIDDKVGAVDEAAFVTGEKDDGVSLLDGFPEAAARKVDLTPVALFFVISEPVLEERGAERVSAIRGSTAQASYLRGAGQIALKRKPAIG